MRRWQTVLALIAVLVSAAFQGYAGEKPEDKRTMDDMLADIGKAVVFLEARDDQGRALSTGTGCLVGIDGCRYLLTAKHVIMEEAKGQFTGKPMPGDFHVLLNRVDGSRHAVSLDEVRKTDGIDWAFHPIQEVDIALMPFPVRPDFDVFDWPDRLFVDSSALRLMDNVFFLARQIGYSKQILYRPILRRGVISLVSDDGSFLVDATMFPGNSGSPVFVIFDAWNADRIGANDSIRLKHIRLAGILKGYVHFPGRTLRNGTGESGDTFLENTGLSFAWPMDRVREIVALPEVQEQAHRLKALSTQRTRGGIK